MMMNGRGGNVSSDGSGGWSSGSSSSLPQNLTVDSRSGNEPPEYKASYSIEFIPDFESGSNDEFSAYITSDNGSSGGSGSSTGGTGNGTISEDGSYRYGFNGKEIDGEVSGYGNQYDYGMRIYDPRIGRFKSVDPIAMDYPWYTPYQFAGNSPIMHVDLDGAEPQGFMEYWDTKTDGMDHWGRSVRNVYDYQTKQTWSVMREPNSTRIYYWQRYDNEHGNWDNNNHVNNYDRKNDQWKGKWVEFKPRHVSEMDKQIADAFETGFVGLMTGIAGGGFAEGGATAVTPLLEDQAVNLMARLYPHLPAIGAAGRLMTEFLDETGSTGAANQGLKLTETIFQEAKGLIGATFKFSNGKVLDFLGNKVINGKALEITDAILYPQNAEGNEEAGKFGMDAMKSILDELKGYAKSQGFEQLKITYKRVENSSSAKPGHTVEKIFNLNE